MMKWAAGLFLVLPVCMCTGCSGSDTPEDTEEPNTRVDIVLSAAESAVNAKVQSASVDMVRELNKLNEEANLCFSPLSLSLDLGMLLNGAKSAAYDELIKVLGFEGLSVSDVNSYSKAMLQALPGMDKKSEVEIYNSVWLKSPYHYETAFANACASYYEADMADNLPFDASTASLVNAWFKEKIGMDNVVTAGELQNATVALANALSFVGKWAKAFGASSTKDRSFRLLNNDLVQVPTMYANLSVYVYYDDDVMVAGLPYGNGAYSMYLFMPRYDVAGTTATINDVISGLTGQKWQQWMTGGYQDSQDVFLPKFAFKQQLDLVPMLKALGVTNLFSGACDNLTGITAEQEQLFISMVKQLTEIEVDESGTVARAATVAMGDLANIGPPKKLNFDHPFGFAIAEKSTGAILFAGKVVDPR